jgi:hypothetical protein
MRVTMAVSVSDVPAIVVLAEEVSATIVGFGGDTMVKVALPD